MPPERPDCNSDKQRAPRLPLLPLLLSVPSYSCISFPGTLLQASGRPCDIHPGHPAQRRWRRAVGAVDGPRPPRTAAAGLRLPAPAAPQALVPMAPQVGAGCSDSLRLAGQSRLPHWGAATPPAKDVQSLPAVRFQAMGNAQPNLASILGLAALPPPSLRRLRAAAHSAVMLYCLRLAPLICTSAPMETPPARQLTSRLARLLSQTSLLSLHPLSMAPPAGDGAAECCAVLRFAQLVLGLLAPLALQARAEAALFQQHQRQRSRAGLPPERGFTANLHAVTCSMLHLVARPQLCICCLLTLGLCWLLAVGSAGGAASS